MFNQSSTVAKKDMELDQPPEDSVSKVAFAPNSNYLVASSWDNNVSCSVRMWLETGTFYLMHTTYIITSQIRCYEVQATGSICKAQQSHTGPILDCCWYQVSGEREKGLYICTNRGKCRSWLISVSHIKASDHQNSWEKPLGIKTQRLHPLMCDPAHLNECAGVCVLLSPMQLAWTTPLNISFSFSLFFCTRRMAQKFLQLHVTRLARFGISSPTSHFHLLSTLLPFGVCDGSSPLTTSWPSLEAGTRL